MTVHLIIQIRDNALVLHKTPAYSTPTAADVSRGARRGTWRALGRAAFGRFRHLIVLDLKLCSTYVLPTRGDVRVLANLALCVQR